MSEQVYLIGDLRDRVLDQLWREPDVMTAEAMAERMSLPVWAVEKGLEASRIDGHAEPIGAWNGVPWWGIAPRKARVGLSAAERSAVANISTFLED